MLFKLMSWGLSPKFCRIMKSMYDKLTACVKIGNKRTDFFISNVGTRQGCPLSPFLFNIFLNDFPNILEKNENICKPVKLGTSKINILMYADDILLISDTPKGLQNCISEI